ncbi:MAG: aminotransferase class V-fold PLP-dependent enzyme [Chloroflexota bacterium]
MLREHFPIFEHTHYINSCSKGALSHEVRAAYEQYMQDWVEQGSPWELWVTNLENYRAQVAGLFNATPDEMAIKTSVSDAVNALASALDYSGERNKIIVDDFAFPTTAQIWHAQAKHGAEIVHVPEADNTTIPLEHYAEAIDDNTLLVSIAHVCYRNGAKQDAKAIIDLAHQHGAMVLLDSFQGVGTFDIDVKALDVDFFTGGNLKYMMGSSGTAFLYVREDHIESLYPTATGWFAQENIFAMDIYANAPSPTARRFENGTPPNPNIYAAQAGLDLLAKATMPAIKDQLAILTGAIKDRANEAGYQVVTPANHGAMIAIKSTDVEQLVGCLAEDNVVVSSRDGNLRISPHFYNDLSDIDALFAGLKKHAHLLA